MQASAPAYAADQPRVGASQRRRAIIATVIGNGLEWFDFTVYSFFAVIIAKLFFPTGDELTSLLLAVATFGVGFFMRPVGGIILGIYADRVGRKAALSLTILLMALGTTLIGIAPTYDQIGLFAPLLIVVARLMQGFSAGGEMGGATAFLTEYAPENQRAYYSSWIQASIGVAVLLGAAVGTFVTASLSTEALNSWGWRLPFLLGMVIGPVGYYIRHHLEETPTFRETTDKTDSPLTEVLRDYPRQTAASFSMVILWTVCTYVLLFYMPTYAVKVLKVPQSTGFVAGMAGGMAIMVFAPIVGLLADRIGRRGLLSGAAALIFVLVRCADRHLYRPDPGRLLGAVPGQGAVHGTFRGLQHGRDDLRRLRLVLHHVADRHHGQHDGTGLLRDDCRRHQLRRHASGARARLSSQALNGSLSATAS
jgi:MHS family proline/betaine transporter-like MFS transporter